MTQPTARPRSTIAAHPITSTAIAILLVAAIFFTLYVPIYAKTTPKVGDFPFFYFYLLIYMPIISAALFLVVMLQKRLGRPADAPEQQYSEVAG